MVKVLAPAAAISQEKLKVRLQTKRSSIRAIDQGTLYDIPGKLRKLARAIENGEIGEVRDAVLILSNTSNQISSYALGKSDRIRAHWMVTTVKNRLEPS